MAKREKDVLPPEIAAKFQKNLVRLRQGAGFDQAALEQRAELEEGLVSRLEEGVELPSYEDLTRLGGALGVDGGVFFAGIKWTSPADGGNGYELDEPDQQSPR
jgi:transcriptional regulator with XRE-family HTH domain